MRKKPKKTPEAHNAVEHAMDWLHRQSEKRSLDHLVEVVQQQPGAVRVIDQRPVVMIVVFSDGSGVGVNQRGLDLLEPSQTGAFPEWNPDDWDGMTEEEAFDCDCGEVLRKLGKEVASQMWSGGSDSVVYEYKGQYFVMDEVETCEYDNPKDAFERAGIGRDTFDSIVHMHVARGYEQYVNDTTDKQGVSQWQH